ncbi:MAG: hypothetical protein WBQ21_08650 [Solirubrobacteraceae bacterium]
MQEDHEHHTRHHVQLPSGRQIEVVYLDNANRPLGQEPACAPAVPCEALHVCPRCTGGLVHPLDWAEESPGRWRISMRCPDCDLLREGVFGQALVERLDEELDKATGALLSDLKQLTHANMTEEIELFARALELDLIGPNDF